MRHLPPVAPHAGPFIPLFGLALFAGLAGCAGPGTAPPAAQTQFQSGTVLAVRPVPLPAAAPAALRIEGLLGQVSAMPETAREIILRLKDGSIRSIVQTGNMPAPAVGSPFALTSASPAGPPVP